MITGKHQCTPRDKVFATDLLHGLLPNSREVLRLLRVRDRASFTQRCNRCTSTHNEHMREVHVSAVARQRKRLFRQTFIKVAHAEEVALHPLQGVYIPQLDELQFQGLPRPDNDEREMQCMALR